MTEKFWRKAPYVASDTRAGDAIPSLGTAIYRCVAIAADGRWVSSIARADLTTDQLLGNAYAPPRQGHYDPSGLSAPPCTEASLDAAIWRPTPPQVLVVGSREEMTYIPASVIGSLPVVVIAVAGRRLWGDVPADLATLCHEREIVADPARSMTPLMVRAWRMARITEALLQAVWNPADLVKMSRSPEEIRDRKRRRRHRRAHLH